MSDDKRVQVGSWVTFYQAGTLVLAVVRYVRTAKRWPNQLQALTDSGAVDVDDIIEVRNG
jgi:hypothetical protein